jgi:hypothetical protein
MRRLVSVLVLAVGAATAADARSPSEAPPLPPPDPGVFDIVNVDTAQELADACWDLASNQAIVIAPGTYDLSDVVFPNGVDCSRGVALGLVSSQDHDGGVVRNNFFRWNPDAAYQVDVPIYTTSPGSAMTSTELSGRQRLGRSTSALTSSRARSLPMASSRATPPLGPRPSRDEGEGTTPMIGVGVAGRRDCRVGTRWGRAWRSERGAAPRFGRVQVWEPSRP